MGFLFVSLVAALVLDLYTAPASHIEFQGLPNFSDTRVENATTLRESTSGVRLMRFVERCVLLTLR
jgi:hypothetical protein